MLKKERKLRLLRSVFHKDRCGLEHGFRYVIFHISYFYTIIEDKALYSDSGIWLALVLAHKLSVHIVSLFAFVK